MKAQILLTGTILTLGKRVVSEAQSIMGLPDNGKFAQCQIRRGQSPEAQ
jgi:hypothetical protein